MSYAELFCRSNFSFLQGASHPEELVIQADYLGYQALAITDECSVAGVVRAHSAIREHGLRLRLLIGSYFRFDQLELILLCPHRQAYAELCRTITNARRRAEKGTYQLSEWDINALRECLVLWLPSGDEQADSHWGQQLSRYHRERLWIACRRSLHHLEHRYQAQCQQLARQWQLPVVACGDVLMHCPSRQPLQHVLTAVRLGTTVQQAGRQLSANCEGELRPLAKVYSLFPAQWLSESLLISQRCDFDLDSLRYEYPSELVPEGMAPMAWLRQRVAEGCLRRFPEGVPEKVAATIAKELDLIEELNYVYYFLTIDDIVRFAREQGILYQGRGSAANSVVCYCLEITAVDPRQISVLFERFISRERGEPPDIDVDFEHERREEVIQYIYGKYGRQRAALAATVISYRIKSAIRDVGKALGINETRLDFFIRNLNRRDKDNPWSHQLTELGLNSQGGLGQHFVELVEQIRGFPRHLSQHVGGFVISAGPLYELVPVENAAMAERTVIQWDKDDLESLGLLKVDVLALGMLTAIRKAFTLIQRHYPATALQCFGVADSRSLSIADITRLGDDPAVYHMVQQADTVGLFQIESRAQMSMLPRLKPACYYDLVIQIAIVRPGPIQGDMVHPFLKRRNGEEAVDYPSAEVEGVLSRTMGVPIFQEQVIQIAMVAAGFSGGEADQLRRAMASWKKTGKLVQFEQKLIKGMLERGYSRDYAERIYNQICGFGEYGFPESHSASFAVLAYASAWLKFYFPAVFYTAVLNSLPMGFYSPSQLVQDARRHQVAVLQVCVNHSQWDHQLEEAGQALAIRLGLRLVNGLSKTTGEQLLQHRPAVGYRHISELIRLGVRKNELEALASANALQVLSSNRYDARWQLMDSAHGLALLDTAPDSDQAPMPVEPGGFTFQPNAINDLLEDYTAVGLTLGEHPVALLQRLNRLTRFTPAAELKGVRHQAVVTVIGLVTGRQSPGTASGVTFVTLEDHTGNINVVVWSATARAQKQPFLTAKLLQVQGVLEREGEVIHVIAGRMTDLGDQLHGLGVRSRDFH